MVADVCCHVPALSSSLRAIRSPTPTGDMVSRLPALALRASSTGRNLATPSWLRPRPRLPKHQQTRSWLSTDTRAPATAPNNIAVLGGGLTGLTTAYYLTRFHPTASITLYEADDRLGGWLDTQLLHVGKRAPPLQMERGARTVAPQRHVPKWEDFVLFELVRCRPTTTIMHGLASFADELGGAGSCTNWTAANTSTKSRESTRVSLTATSTTQIT